MASSWRVMSRIFYHLLAALVRLGSVLAAPRTWRSSSCATRFRYSAATSTGPPSTIMTGPCSQRSPQHSPAGSATAGSSRPTRCCAGTAAVSRALDSTASSTSRQAAHQRRDPPADRAPRHREPGLGPPTHPRRACRPRTQDCVVDRVADPARQQHRPRAGPLGGNVDQVPALSGSRCV